VIFCLPFPPSTNHYYRIFGGMAVISPTGRLYAEKVRLRLQRSWVPPITDPVKLEVLLCPPDRKRRDLDNFAGKALLDAIKKAGVYEDDSLIDELRAIRGTVIKPGFALVRITPLPPNRNPWGVFTWAMSEEATRALRQGGVQLERGLLDVPADEEVEETEPAF
jgi:crossover junction endodeoxyribonuclease RusA